jgi:hypothetical protein
MDLVIVSCLFLVFFIRALVVLCSGDDSFKKDQELFYTFVDIRGNPKYKPCSLNKFEMKKPPPFQTFHACAGNDFLYTSNTSSTLKEWVLTLQPVQNMKTTPFQTPYDFQQPFSYYEYENFYRFPPAQEVCSIPVETRPLLRVKRMSVKSNTSEIFEAFISLNVSKKLLEDGDQFEVKPHGSCYWSTSRIAEYPEWITMPTAWRRSPTMMVSATAASCKFVSVCVQPVVNRNPTFMLRCINDNPYSLSAPHEITIGSRNIAGLEFERIISWALRESILVDIPDTIVALQQLSTSRAHQNSFTHVLPALFPLCMPGGGFDCEFIDRPSALVDATMQKFRPLVDIYDLYIYLDDHIGLGGIRPHLDIPIKYKSDMEELYYSMGTDQERLYFLTILLKSNDMRIKFCTRRATYPVPLLTRNSTGIYLNCLSTFFSIRPDQIRLFELNNTNPTQGLYYDYDI